MTRLSAGDLVHGLPELGDGALSPSGTRLALSLTEIGGEPELRVLDMTTLAVLERFPGAWGSVDWRGEVLTAVCGRDVLVPGVASPLVSHESNVKEIAWSPDGSSLAFTAFTGGPAPGDPFVTDDLFFRYDGRGLVGSGRDQIFLFDGTIRRLTDGLDDHSDLRWSPDGRRLAAKASRGVDDSARAIVIDPAAGSIEDHSPDAWVETLFFSADGALVVVGDPDRCFHPCAVWAGDPLRQIVAPGDVAFDWGGAVAASGEILMPGCADGRGGVYVIDVLRGEMRRLIEDDGRFSGIMTAGMTVLAWHERATEPPALVTLPELADALRPTDRVSDRAARATVHRLRADHDGATVHGHVLLPPGFDPDGAYPAVVDIHGGPMSPGWTGTFQPRHHLHAAHGFVVIAPDPRAAGGYGRHYATELPLGGHLYDGTLAGDVLAFCDHALDAFPAIDRARVGVWGSSWGGYCATWLLATTDRFAAGVVRAPVFDLSAAWLATDGPLTGWEMLPGPPWEHRERIASTSANFHAHRITAPTLVSVGAEDLRTLYDAAVQLHTTLCHVGTRSRFVSYPGTSHQMLWEASPAHREHLLAIGLEWFAEHLCGAAS